MKKNIALIAFCALGLSGCGERENPLKSFAAQDVAKWIYTNKTPEIMTCAPAWENQATASPEHIEACTPEEISLAALLTKARFGDVKPRDIALPTIWSAFDDLAKAAKMNTFDAEKAGNAMKLPEAGSLGDKIEAYKRQRENR